MKNRSFLLISILAVFLAACTAYGGGWLTSQIGSGKATFGFNVNCALLESNTIELYGQIQYKDLPAGVKFHGDVHQQYVVSESDSCDDAFITNTPTFFGSYWMEPSGETGEFSLRLRDEGEPGPGAGDYFQINLYEDRALFSPIIYTNDGTIEGGNIQIR